MTRLRYYDQTLAGSFNESSSRDAQLIDDLYLLSISNLTSEQSPINKIMKLIDDANATLKRLNEIIETSE